MSNPLAHRHDVGIDGDGGGHVPLHLFRQILRSKELDEAHVARLDGCEVTPMDNPWNDAPEADVGVTVTLVFHDVFLLQLQGRTKKVLKMINSCHLKANKTPIQFLDSLH